MFRNSIILLSFLFVSVASFAQEGGPPMLTDDARVADYKEWELNPSINFLVIDHLTLSAPHIDLNYGILPGLQLKFEAPLLLDFHRKEDTEINFGVLNFGVKYRFMNEEKTFVSAAVFPQYNFTGDRGLLMPIFIEKTIGRVLFGIANAYFFGEDQQDRYEFGVLAGWRATEKFHIMLEYYNVNNLHTPKGSNGYVNLGYRGEVTESFFLMGSFGTQVLTPEAVDKTKFISWIGVKFLF